MLNHINIPFLAMKLLLAATTDSWFFWHLRDGTTRWGLGECASTFPSPPPPSITFRIESALFSLWFILVRSSCCLMTFSLIIPFFENVKSLSQAKSVMYVKCYRLGFQNTTILVILNTFCSKCTLYYLPFSNKQYNNQGYGKTENSGGANALILKNIGAKLRKKVIFGTILLTFFQKLGK